MNETRGCDCRSHSLGVGDRPEVLLPPPDWVVDERSAWPDAQDVDRPVVVDACIAPAVQALWSAGYVTLGSCCGHGTDTPSLVLGEGERDYGAVRRVIATVDDRDFQLMQWQLVEVSPL